QRRAVAAEHAWGRAGDDQTLCRQPRREMSGERIGIHVEQRPIAADANAGDDRHETIADERFQQPHVGVLRRNANAAKVHRAPVPTADRHPRHCRDHARQQRAIFEQLAAELEDKRPSASCDPHNNPVLSSIPSITFMFCTAWPDAPFSRLSMTDTRTARPESSTRHPISQKFVWATCLISGRDDPTSLTNVVPAYARSYTSASASSVVPGATRR